MNLTTLTRSSTLRLMLTYVALFVTSMLLVLALFYWSTLRDMRGQMDVTIKAEVVGLAERFETSGLRGLAQLIAQRVRRDTPTSDSIYLFTDKDYRRITGNLNAWPTVAEQMNTGWVNFDLIRDGAETRSARAHVFSMRGGYHLLVGRDVHTLENIKNRLLNISGWAVALTLLLGVAGAFAMTRSLMRPIEAINATSKAIVRSGDLSRRIPERGGNDDLDELTQNLNGMLTRIDDLMMGVRRVSDSIAHDLRTPLTRLRNRLELARIGDGDEQSHHETITRALEETDGLLNTFNALLRISRIETGDARRQFELFNLTEVLIDVAELYEPVAEEVDVTLTLDSPSATAATFQGDRDLVIQCLANLVDNAVKFSPAGGEIEIALTLGTEDNGHQIRITDQGPGIDKELRERVFDRFFRTDSARSGDSNGLGLSLVKAVLGLHGATIALDDNDPGLIVTLTFPGVTQTT